MPDPTPSPHASEVPGRIIWIAGDRPGGDSGRGGNLAPDPPRRAEAPGRDPLTVAARPRASLEPAPLAATPSEQRIDIPALPAAAGLTEMPGVMAPAPTNTLS